MILSYTLDPLIMSTLCAVAMNWEGRCFDEASWLDTVVDVPSCYKPLGRVAWNHFRNWKLTKFVVVRPWMLHYCGLLMDSSVQPWQWSKPRPVLHDIPVVTLPRIVPGFKDTMWRRCRGTWFRIGTPAPICDIRVRLHICNGGPAPDFCFGLANTTNVCELTALMMNQYDGCGLLDLTSTEVEQLQYYHCRLRRDCVFFYLNSRVLCEAVAPQVQGSVVIKFSVVDNSKLLFGIDDSFFFQALLPADGIRPEDYHFPVLGVNESEWPQDYVCLPFAEPLLSRKGDTKR